MGHNLRKSSRVQLHAYMTNRQKKKKCLPLSFRKGIARQGGLRRIPDMKYGHVPSTLELLNKPLITAIVLYLEVPEVHALSQTCTALRRITRDPDIRARAIVNSVGAYLAQEDEEEATTTATIRYNGMITRTVLQAYTWGGFEMTTDILSHIHGADAYCVGLVTACEKGWIDVVRWLLPYVVGYNKAYAESNVFYLHSALEGAIVGHHWNIALELLKTGYVDPSFNDNKAVFIACDQGHVDMLQLLMVHPCVDPSACDNLAITIASTRGYLPIVKQLLTDKRVDASTQSSYSLREACKNGHTQVVEYLMKLPDVDPTVHNNICVRSACKYNHIEVVKLLLKDPRVDPSACYNEAIVSAQDGGHEAVIRVLLEDLRVNKSGLSIDF